MDHISIIYLDGDRPKYRLYPHTIMNFKMSKKEVRNNLIFLVVFIGIIVLGRGGHIQRAYLMTGLGNASSAPNIENSAPPTQDVVLMDMSGDLVLLSQLHGKTVFVNLWATWCGPCVAEMPSISSLYEKVDKDKVAFVMITRNDPKSADKVVKFLERGEYSFPSLLASECDAAEFELQFHPCHIRHLP